MADTAADRIQSIFDYLKETRVTSVHCAHRDLAVADLEALLDERERMRACIRDFAEGTNSKDPGKRCGVCGQLSWIDGHSELCPHTTHADTIKGCAER